MKCKKCDCELERVRYGSGLADFYFDCPECNKKMNKLFIIIIGIILGLCWIWFFVSNIFGIGIL